MYFSLSLYMEHGRYEAVFYGALALALMAWLLFENTLLYLSKTEKITVSNMSMVENAVLETDDRYLRLSDVRIPLTFVSSFSSLHLALEII